MPLEEEAERRGGRLPDDVVADGQAGGAWRPRLNGGLHAPEHGGQGWTRLEWALVEEQYGRTTNALHWHVPDAYNVWAHASAEQVDRYLRPALRGELKDAYAVTERDAGSDPSSDRGHRRADRRGVPAQRGEVVRDVRRRRGRLRGDGERDRRARAAAHPLRRRPRAPGDRDRRQPAPTRTTIRTATRRSPSATWRSPSTT